MPELPATFWAHPAMRRALAARDAGHLIGAYRLHPHWRKHSFLGRPTVGQWIVAGWLGISQAKLSRLESGKEEWDPFLVLRAMQVLKIPRRLLWFTLPDRAVPRELDAMDAQTRRAFLAKAGGAAVVVGASVLTTGATPVTARIDPELVPLKLELLGVLVAQSYLRGTHATERLLRSELVEIRERRQHARGEHRRKLMRLEAVWTDYAAWLRHDLGDVRSALRLLASSARLADEADDRLTVAYVRAHQSALAIESGDVARAVALAEAAQREPDLTPPVRALGVLREAQARSLIGASATLACRRKIDIAHGLVERSQSGTWVPRLDGLGCEFTTLRWLQASEATCLLRLGQPRHAADLYEQALTASKRPLGRGLQGARLAVALAAAGEPDRAAAEGLQALDMAQATGSASITRDLRDLARRLAGYDTSSARTFRDAFHVAHRNGSASLRSDAGA